MDRLATARTSRRNLATAALLGGTLLVASGCNNAGEGALTGAGIGAVTGLIIGSYTGNAGAGAAIGAAVGGAGGAIIGDQNERNERNHRHHSSGTYHKPQQDW